ncbi:Translation initiation factor eIF2B, subunit beta [Chondrus crispus]|uniref:Translation initiation factor eIF2B subunit beta n=1 Tax=Chondrus crispus TaxID=2769 RepID=R7Q467_CHOCR|nr:Translation initiation factor eIF2B, subunit beta [Chondrus crispus]CDF32136.1 Translation initiation factor eIF2B, subunit beta [Chondrus crispus]|eukprot:XP_005711801.1 Translation initiation factor eIF2B, subunit beta [Chondrus crispus]
MSNTTPVLSEALRKASKEVMRLSEAGNTPLDELAERICLLLRVAALTSADPPGTVTQIRDQLRPFIPQMCILEAIAGRVLYILNESFSDSIEHDLDALLDEVREAKNELVEQTSAMFSGGDSIMMLGNDEGTVLEAALRDAAEALSDDPIAIGNPIRVAIVQVAPDHEGKARATYGRLKNVSGLKTRLIRDSHITSELRRCTKVILRAIAMDVDDGCLCFSGSGIITAAANRMRIPVVLVMARHRIVPVGNASVAIMSQQTGSPGKVWCYEEARDDRKHDAISVHSSIYDLVPLQKCEMVVTEFGGYSADYVKTFAAAVTLDNSNTSSPR